MSCWRWNWSYPLWWVILSVGCTFWQFWLGWHKSRHFWWRFCFRWHRHEHNEWDKWQMEWDRRLCCHEMTNQTDWQNPVQRWQSVNSGRLFCHCQTKNGWHWPWQWKFSWGFRAQRGPNNRWTFPPWLICQIYPPDGIAIISSAGLGFCIHLFETAGSPIFFCVDYTLWPNFQL